MVRVFERRTLRMIYSPVNDHGILETGYNNEIYTHYDELDLNQFGQNRKTAVAGTAL